MGEKPAQGIVAFGAKMTVAKSRRILSKILLVVALLLSLTLFLQRSGTPAIKDAQGNHLPQSIASLEQVRLGGLEQYILVRGKNRSNPVLLFLHGGPGMPMMYLAHAFQRELENNFVVVQWDRRGAGKTYRRDAPVESMTVGQMIADTRELVDLLRGRFQQDKIYLAGHSWGTYLGMLVIQRYPELFHAYAGIGQIADNQKARDVQLRFLRQRAVETGDREALREMEPGASFDREKWLFRYGAELHRGTNFWPLLWTGLRAPEYSLLDAFNVSRGVNFSHKYMQDDVLQGELMDNVVSVNVPVYFFCGRYDYTVPFELTSEYLEKLKAPRKAMVWFEDSAHFPFFEESGKFAAEMRKMAREHSPKTDSATK